MAMLASVLKYEMQWLRQRLQQIDKSPADFARWLAIPPPRVYEMLKGRRRLQQGEISKAAQFLGISEGDVLALAEGRSLPSVSKETQGSNFSVISTDRPSGQIDAPNPARQSHRSDSEGKRQGTGRLTGDVREYPVDLRWVPNKLPVFAASDTGGGIVALSAQPVEMADLPHFVDGVEGVFATYTVTDEMSPAYERGDRPLINPARPAREGEDVLLLTGEVGKGAIVRAALRRLVGISPTHWRVKQWNPPKTEKFDRKEWPIAYRVESKRNR